MADRCRSMRLATFWEMVRGPAGNVVNEMPPPGCHFGYPGTETTLPVTPIGEIPRICGDLDALPLDTTYVGQLSDIWGDLPEPETFLAGLRDKASKRELGFLQYGLGSWPLLYQTESEHPMRWVRVTFRGTLGSVEQFQHKIDLVHPDGSDADVPNDAFLLGIATAHAGYWKTAAEFSNGVSGGQLVHWLADDVVYTEVGAVTLNQAAANGVPEQDGPTQWFAYATGGKVLGAGGTALPYETSCCVTLQSETRGARGRGRFYLPPFGTLGMANGGVYASTAIAAVGRCVDKYFDQVITEGTYAPAVISLAGGVHHLITSANVGSVPDSQRRRRKSQVEARANAWPQV